MCVLSIKVPIRKKSGNSFNDPRLYIYKHAVVVYTLIYGWMTLTLTKPMELYSNYTRRLCAKQTHGRPKFGRPVRTYIQHLCADTECSLKDIPGAMDDREGWRQRIREIYASRLTWWWWWYMMEINPTVPKKRTYRKT